MVVLPATNAARMFCGSTGIALASCADQTIDGFEHQAAQFFQAFRGAGIVDAADDVGAAADLRVVSRSRVASTRSVFEIDQLGGYRRGSDIDGQPRQCAAEWPGCTSRTRSPGAGLFDANRDRCHRPRGRLRPADAAREAGW